MSKKIFVILAALLIFAGAYFFMQANVDDGSNMKKEFEEIRDKGNPLVNEQQTKTKKAVPPQSGNTSNEFKKIKDKGNPLANKN